jgi:hypothetical protein
MYMRVCTRLFRPTPIDGPRLCTSGSDDSWRRPQPMHEGPRPTPHSSTFKLFRPSHVCHSLQFTQAPPILSPRHPETACFSCKSQPNSRAQPCKSKARKFYLFSVLDSDRDRGWLAGGGVCWLSQNHRYLLHARGIRLLLQSLRYSCGDHFRHLPFGLRLAGGCRGEGNWGCCLGWGKAVQVSDATPQSITKSGHLRGSSQRFRSTEVHIHQANITPLPWRN